LRRQKLFLIYHYKYDSVKAFLSEIKLAMSLEESIKLLKYAKPALLSEVGTVGNHKLIFKS
jgi:hypothetical protein